MTHRWTKFSVAGLVALLVGCSAWTHEVVPVKGDFSQDAVIYTLPRLRATATVTAAIVTNKLEKAPCRNEAELKEKLGIKDAKFAGSRLLVKKGALSKRAEPDPDQIYALDLSEGNGLALKMTDAGIPTEATTMAHDPTLGIVTAALKTVLSLATAARFGSGAGGEEAVAPPSVCSELAGQINALRELRRDLRGASGGAHPKEILEYKEVKIDAEEAALVSLFNGVTSKPYKIVCDLAPTDQNNVNLFRYTQGGGVNGVHDECFVPTELYRVSAESDDCDTELALGKARALSMRFEQSAASLGSQQGAKGSGDGNRSFYYRLPAESRVWLAKESGTADTWKPLSDVAVWMVPQFGVTRSLPRLKTKGSVTAQITLSGETGALTSVKIERTGADTAGTISGVGAELVAMVKSLEERDQELERLKRTQAVLEAQVAIEAAQEALADDSDEDGG